MISPRTVEVKQKHLNAGMKCSSVNCPIVLALREAVPEYEFSAGSEEASIYNKVDGVRNLNHATRIGRIILPGPACTFIRRFDGGWSKQEPFSFELSGELVHFYSEQGKELI